MVRILTSRAAAGNVRELLTVNVQVPAFRGAAVLATVDLICRSTGRIGPEDVPDALPVAEAFLMALAVAEREGLAFVWINDPLNLFPAEVWPVRELVS